MSLASLAPPLLDLTNDLREITRLAGADEGIDGLLRRGLDWLARIAPYDLATVFVVDGNDLVVRAARGPLAGDKVRGHRLSLARFPTVREALELRRARAFTEGDHRHGDGDPFDGVLDLPPGHSCMVVPLFAGERNLGILTLDRAQCEVYSELVVNLVEVYGQVLALAIAGAEQRGVLGRLRRQDEEHARLLEDELAGPAAEAPEATQTAAVRTLYLRARQVAETDTPVLVVGETGTGKEHLARAIHRFSRRAQRPFVKINCAAIPAGLIESELFGHVRGAFTGATRDRPGRFSVANGGTLLLDEVGELPIDLQPKLLRVLQEGTFEPVGSDRTTRVDVRILAATHVELERAMAERRFREDLFYRLNVFPLVTVPLRERLDDLPDLCARLLTDLARRTGRPRARVTAGGLAKLRSHAWPGNIRELANVLERACILRPTGELDEGAFDLPAAPARRTTRVELPAAEDEVLTMDAMQRAYITRVLTLSGGRIYGKGGAAERLAMKPSTLQSRMKKLGVRAPGAATG